jgi:hypothetical protein
MLLLSPNTCRLTAFPSPAVAVAPALGRAFDAAWHHHGLHSEERLMEATFALVRRLKDDGLPPEKVLVALKTALTKYAELHSAPSLNADDEDPDGVERVVVYRHVFEWFLEAYYQSGD